MLDRNIRCSSSIKGSMAKPTIIKTKYTNPLPLEQNKIGQKFYL